LPANVGVETLWEVSLYRQGLRYEQSALRVVRHGNEQLVDFLPPLRINGPTRVVFSPMFKESDPEKTIASKIVLTYALMISNEKIHVPLEQVINNITDFGQLVVYVKPKIGWERFVANLEKVWGLLK